MSAAPAPDAAIDRTGLVAALVCYGVWGLFPLMFHAAGAAGASSWEIVGCRTLFAAPVAALLVLVTGRVRATLAILSDPVQTLQLVASAGFVALNWSVYVLAVGAHQTLAASLGYYLNPLLNAAVGAFLFRERISPMARVALGLAAVGVAIQAVGAIGALLTPMVLAASFSTYGVIRRQSKADAQTGLLVECLFLAPLAAGLLVFLKHHGDLHLGADLQVSALLVALGPATVAPLALFAFAARRLPFNVVGFIQFLCPALQFVCGLMLGEKLNVTSLIAFAFIWTGAGVFAFDLLRRLKRQSAV